MPWVSEAAKARDKFLVEVPRIKPSEFPTIFPLLLKDPVISSSFSLVLSAPGRNPNTLASGAVTPKVAPRALPRSSAASTIKASISICFVLTSNSLINRSIKSSSGLVALTIK